MQSKDPPGRCDTLVNLIDSFSGDTLSWGSIDIGRAGSCPKELSDVSRNSSGPVLHAEEEGEEVEEEEEDDDEEGGAGEQKEEA